MRRLWPLRLFPVAALRLTRTPEPPAEDAPDATVVLQVPPGFASTWYELRAVMYDPSTHNVNTAHPGWGSPRYLAGRRFGGHFLLTHNENDPKKYIVQSVKPGPYVFGTFAVKYQWAGCFHKETLSFEIKPGEVLFLGQFDPLLPSAEVLREAAKAGQFKAYAGSSRFEYMDNISAPRLKQPDERNLAEVRKYAAAELPQIRARSSRFPTRAQISTASPERNALEGRGSPPLPGYCARGFATRSSSVSGSFERACHRYRRMKSGACGKKKRSAKRAGNSAVKLVIDYPRQRPT